MIALASVPVLLGYLVFVGWRVRAEGGVVHRKPTLLERLARAFRDFEVALGAALLPAVVEAARRMEEFAAAFVATREQAAAALGRVLCLPDGYYVDYDTRALLEDEEGTP